MKGDKIDKIYYGNIEKNEKLWNSVNITNPAKKQDIHVCKNGKVYIENKETGVIKDIFSGSEKKYNGRVIQYYNKGAGALYNGKFVKVEL